MHIKIYFGDKPLFLADTITPEIEPYVHHDDAILMDEFSSPGIKSMIHEMKLAKIHAGIFVHSDLKALQKAFWKKFLVIQAAGGLVLNDNNEVLMIFRRGKWDLPKGKLDAGESLETCAIREIKEETGLKEVSITKKLVITYHTYDESGHHILKETHWYLMQAANDQSLEPQVEEQITEIDWVKPADLKKYAADTYPAIIDVLKSFGFEV